MAHVKDEVLFGAEIKKRVREMAGEERMKPLRKGFDHINGVSGTKEMGVLVKDIRVGGCHGHRPTSASRYPGATER